jgi:hypothetical protein
VRLVGYLKEKHEQFRSEFVIPVVKIEGMHYRPSGFTNIKLHVEEWSEIRVHCFVLVSCEKVIR